MSTSPPGASSPRPAKSPEEINRELRARVAAASPAPPEPKREGLRDTVESIVFALILAFLFRTFEAEAFVIPTGSMAPTLYGRDLMTTFDPMMGWVDPMVVPRSLGAVSPDAEKRLLAHADENRPGDNPSPYVLLPNGQRVDIGHVLLSMDALLHPRTASPYTDYDVPNIDPAGWVADVGIATVWLTHAEEGDPHPGAPANPPPPSVEAYFRLSAPDEDLLGDVDAFRLEQSFVAQPSTLSAALRAYYLGGTAGGRPGTETRYQTFCAATGLTYRRSGTSIVWDRAWHNPMIDRIDRFNDLYEAGGWGAARAMITGGTTHRRIWPRTAIMFDRFLAWLKPRLEAELAGPAPRRREP